MNRYYKLAIAGFSWILIIALLGFVNRHEEDPDKMVEVTTNYGVMTFKLYNETPLHRDNFIKLANAEFFDSLLFHRVIDNFMIQGGDPDSKGAENGTLLGEGGPGYDVPAEFVQNKFHKKGALAAAREGDDVNPQRMSSGSQFYIVEGQVFDTMMLQNLERRKMENYRTYEFKKYMSRPENQELLDQYMHCMKTGDRITAAGIMNDVNPKVDVELEIYKFSPEQIEIYTTVGGAPHLDELYTVFGEIVSGLDVLEKISAVKTDENDRPAENVVMTVKVIN